ncbi:MAG: hypothetical protein V1772_06255, partial [Chloroflexota bacterium]
MPVRKLKTETDEFWREGYEVSPDDLGLVQDMILESAHPQPLATLATAIIQHRYQRERELLAAQSGRGQVYRPMDEYRVGQELVFSNMDFRPGRVVGLRPGHNPKYGGFAVIRVAFEDGSEREFAAGLQGELALNRPVESLLVGPAADLDEAMVARLYQPQVMAKLEAVLERDPDLVRFGDAWFLNALLPEVQLGHLNLAEAVIDQANRPLTVDEIITDVGLDLGTSQAAQVFALSRALREDGRFDEVATASGAAWFLRALEPAILFERPALLRTAFRAQGGEQIGITMLDLMDEVGDELDDVEGSLARPVSEVRCEVSFPHLYAGTLPVTAQLRRLLPAIATGHYPITVVDDAPNKRYRVWVAPEWGYMAGLSEWFASVNMVVGGQVTIAPTGEPLTFRLVTTLVRSRRSDWVRSVNVVDGQVVMQMLRASLALRTDRNMQVDVPNMQAVAEAMQRTSASSGSLSPLLRRAFQEIAKLSSRGEVHVKTLHALINMHRRAGLV